MTKRDPYKHEQRYKNWKSKVLENGRQIEGLSKENSEIILRYIEDMEYGINISNDSVKGGRSFIRLNTLRDKCSFFARKFKEFYNLDNIVEIKEEQLLLFFSKMRKGEIQKEKGGEYKSTGYFVKNFKAFWHWYMKYSRKQGRVVQDITIDLDASSKKPKWVYLSFEQFKFFCDNLKWKYKVLVMFLWDTGVRSPSELINIKVADFYDDFKKLKIHDDRVKVGSFGRDINLMLCSDLIKEHVERNNLKSEDYVFDIKHAEVNQYLKRASKRVFGDGLSKAGEFYSNLTMYDFRHCSCCYWLPRYKSENALKYRFGWRKSDKILYYSEFLGMVDTINEDDMIIDKSRTQIEKEMTNLSNENTMLKEKMNVLNEQMNSILKMVKVAEVEQESFFDGLRGESEKKFVVGGSEDLIIFEN